MSLIESFDGVQIINLPYREDRRKETAAEFKKYNIPLNTNRINFFQAIAPDSANGFPSPGVRGCFLSHLRVLENARDSCLTNILVMEDDVQFSKYILAKGLKAIQSLNELDWDIAYFGHAINSDHSKNDWIEVKQPMLLAHFYAVNGKTLDRLINFLNTITERPFGHPDGGPMHYDGALNTFMHQNKDIRAFYYSANLGYQRPSKTDLHKLSILDRSKILAPFTMMMRKLKSLILRHIH